MPSPAGMPSAADRLLAEIADLPFPARTARISKAALDLAARGDLRPVIEELNRRDVFARRVAVLAAAVGRQQEFVTARLSDPDRVVRGHAFRAARKLPLPDEALEAAYADAPQTVRRGIDGIVLRGRSTALAERLVRRLRAEWGDVEAAGLLPACSEEFVARELPGLAHAVRSWPKLARRHPDVVLGHYRCELAESGPAGPGSAWWSRHDSGLAALAACRPAQVTELLVEHPPAMLSSCLNDRLATMARADAEGTARLLLTLHQDPQRPPQPRPSRSALRRLVRAEPPSLTELGRVWLNSYFGSMPELLSVLPPGRRGDFLDAAADGAVIPHSALMQLLRHLPRERRHAEAAAVLARSDLTTWTWNNKLDVRAYGPVSAVWPDLLDALNRPAARERGLVWRWLVGVAGSERVRGGSGDDGRDAVHDLLALMTTRLRDEQDSVRLEALQAFAGLRPALFTDEDAGLLDQIVQDAVEARDSSTQSRQALVRTAVGVLRATAIGGREGAEAPARPPEEGEAGERTLTGWAKRALSRLARRDAGLHLGPLDRTLRRGQEHHVLAALRPEITRELSQGSARLLFSLAGALGTRARRMAELQRLLVRALDLASPQVFRQAAELLLEEPAERDSRVEEIIAREPSAVVLDVVQRVLVTRRTDLLDLLIGEDVPQGRFMPSDGARPLPGAYHGVRWEPRQQAALARLLTARADDTRRTERERAEAVTAAAPLDGHGGELALRYAAAEDTTLAEAALGALPRTDRPHEVLPVLLDEAGGQRARVAVYAAGRAARFVPPSALAEHLGSLLSVDGRAKVTSRKEAVRLAARHLPPQPAADILTGVYRAPGTHRDVRVAVLESLVGRGSLLDQEVSWATLTEATATVHSSPALHAALLRVGPHQLPVRHRVRYARLVGRVSRSADTTTAGTALRALPAWTRYASEIADPLPGLVTDLGRRAGWRDAVEALCELACSGLPHPLGGAAPGSLLHGALDSLLATPEPEPDEFPGARDLPARQRTRAVLETLLSRARRGRPSGPDTRPLREAVASQLAPHALYAHDRAEILRSLVDVDGTPASLLRQLHNLAEAVRGRPLLAAATGTGLRSAFRYRRPRDPEVVLTAARQLSHSCDPVNGTFAVMLATAVGEQGGWPDDWRTLLRELRNHPDPDVRETALNTPADPE